MAIDTKHFKNKLENEKKDLLAELSELGIMNPKTGIWEATPNLEDLAVHEADENDLADHAEDFEERSSTLKVLSARLSEIENALKNIENKSYGKCQQCGKDIEPDRLEANPAAPTCKQHM